MRVLLVGRPAARDRLRRSLAGTGLDVVGEADTLADAKAALVPVEGFLVAAATGDDQVHPLLPTLTARELDVLALLGRGRPNKAIATALGISDQTVKFHVAAICGKLAARNRTEAVRLAIERGLIFV